MLWYSKPPPQALKTVSKTELSSVHWCESLGNSQIAKLLHHKRSKNYQKKKKKEQSSSPQCQVTALNHALSLFPTGCSRKRKKKRHKNYNLGHFLNTLSKQLDQNIKIKRPMKRINDAHKASVRNRGTRQILHWGNEYVVNSRGA